MKKLTSGFTLIEVILAVALLIIIGGFAMSFSTNFFVQNATGNLRDQWMSTLKKAQLYAMSSKGNSNWGVAYNAPTLTLFKGTSYASRDTAWDETYEGNANLSVTGLTEVVFTRITGLPSTTGTTTISGTSSVRTITINSQGVVSQ